MRRVNDMLDKTFLERTLGIARPWYVESAELDPGSEILTVTLNFERGATFACGSCARPGCKAYDTMWRRWRHLDFFEYTTTLEAPSPRARCSWCGVRQALLPWARPRSRFTRALENFVRTMWEEGVPVISVARYLGEHDTRLGYMLRVSMD